ncbi:hypothetical protein AAHC03_020742 [Spirometra sp. Aus1]
MGEEHGWCVQEESSTSCLILQRIPPDHIFDGGEESRLTMISLLTSSKGLAMRCTDKKTTPSWKSSHPNPTPAVDGFEVGRIKASMDVA